jgi:hypothetical protein
VAALAAALLAGVQAVSLRALRSELHRSRQEAEARERALREQAQALERARAERAGLAEQLGRLARPEGAAVFVLVVSRGAGPEAARLSLPPTAQWVVLSLDRAGQPDHPAYRATLEAPDGTVLWTGDALRPTARDSLALAFHSSLLPAGDYVLRLEGRDATGRYVPAARYPFRVVPAK